MSIKKSFISEDSSILKNPQDSITDFNRNEVNTNQKWLQVTGAAFLIEDHPSYYRNLKQSIKSSENKSIKQIEKDICRTFPGDNSFDSQELKNILISYSFRNPNVGYCQGLNFVVAMLLRCGFTEEQAF